MEVWLGVLALVAFFVIRGILRNRAQRRRFESYMAPVHSMLSNYRVHYEVTMAQLPPVGKDRRNVLRTLRDDAVHLQKELVYRKRLVHSDTKSTNRANLGVSLNDRAYARWPSEKATAEIERLIIDIDRVKLDLDRYMRESTR